MLSSTLETELASTCHHTWHFHMDSYGLRSSNPSLHARHAIVNLAMFPVCVAFSLETLSHYVVLIGLELTK